MHQFVLFFVQVPATSTHLMSFKKSTKKFNELRNFLILPTWVGRNDKMGPLDSSHHEMQYSKKLNKILTNSPYPRHLSQTGTQNSNTGLQFLSYSLL